MSDGACGEFGKAWAVLRVRQWIVFAPLPAAAIVRLDELHGDRLWQLAAAMVVSGFSLGYAYGINAIFDRRNDADPQKNVLAGQAKVPTSAIISVILAGIFAIVGASLLGSVTLVSIAISIAAGTLYSAGPRLKHFPGVGLFGNLMIFAPLLASALRTENIPRGFPILVAVFSLLVTQNQLLHEEADVAEDEAAGAWTTARWLGPRKTRAALWLLGIGIALTGLLSQSMSATGICVIAAVSSILIATRIELAKTRRKVHRYLSALAGAALFFTSVLPN